MKEELDVLKLRIIVEGPPPGVEYGLQSGRGRDYQVVQKQTSTGGDVIFELELEVTKPTPGAVDFRGRSIQGPRGGRFIYVDIGTYAGAIESQWARRLKVPLSGLTAEMAMARVCEARVRGTGKDGTPSCATVPATIRALE